VRRATAAAVCACLALLGAGAEAATAADGGSGTYTVTGRLYYFVLVNSGTTPWQFFALVGPAGTTFFAGETATETSARCVAGQPDGQADEIACGPLSANAAPPGLHVTFVATLTAPAACGASFQLEVSSVGMPFTRVGDVTYAGSCAAAAPAAVTPPTLHGTATVGSILTATTPTWSAPPTHVSYQWQLCTATSCASIKGATKLTLELDKRDAGHTVCIVATATVGGVTVTSASKRVAVRARHAR